VVGGASLLLLPLSWLLRQVVGLDPAELAVGFLMFHAAHVINDPHFAVTYLLFYRHVKQRAFGASFSWQQRSRYIAAGFVVPLLLVAWASASIVTGSAQGLGWMIQLMFLLVGWHYVKQGFGVLVVLSGRRGVSYTAVERRAVLAHCFAAWAYAWASPFDPGRTVEEKGVVYSTLAQLYGLERWAQVAFFITLPVLLVMLARKWRREGRLPPLGPLSGLLVTVWLWTVYTSLDPLLMYMIPALHSLQYLYFVWLLKRNQARHEEGPPTFGRPVPIALGVLALSALALGFVLFHALPAILDTALASQPTRRLSELGPTPYFAALFAVVNLHHYFMDFVIWRRDNPDTQYLKS